MERSLNQLEGLAFFTPKDNQKRPGIIVSCGIHGDETAPIEAVQQLQSDLQSGKIHSACPLLLIYGNPQAIQQKRRFVTTNLNRLFGLDQAPQCGEAERALQLELACQEFKRICEGECNSDDGVLLHLDLHSTIKPSLHPKFALEPVSSTTSAKQWGGFFRTLGLTAWVKQTQRSHTFSQFTRDSLHCDSFTVECGSLAQNNLGSHSPNSSISQQIYRSLCSLIQNQNPADNVTAGKTITHFNVMHSISRNSEAFRFLIDESEPNFSLHPAGTAIYCDQQFTYYCDNEVATLFLNSSVALGQRAGLLLSACEC